MLSAKLLLGRKTVDLVNITKMDAQWDNVEPTDDGIHIRYAINEYIGRCLEDVLSDDMSEPCKDQSRMMLADLSNAALSQRLMNQMCIVNILWPETKLDSI